MPTDSFDNLPAVQSYLCRSCKGPIDEWRAQMQIFGYPLDSEVDEPIRLSEVSVVVSVKAMRELATFLASCADEMDSKRKPYGPATHFHLRDFLKLQVDADLIVVPVPE